MALEANTPGLTSWLHHCLAVQPWASYLTSLGFSFLIYKADNNSAYLVLLLLVLLTDTY